MFPSFLAKKRTKLFGKSHTNPSPPTPSNVETGIVDTVILSRGYDIKKRRVGQNIRSVGTMFFFFFGKCLNYSCARFWLLFIDGCDWNLPQLSINTNQSAKLRYIKNAVTKLRSFTLKDKFQYFPRGLSTLMFVSLTRLYTKQCYSLRTAHLIFEAFQIRFLKLWVPFIKWCQREWSIHNGG